VYQSEWLTRFFRRHPWAGFTTILSMLVLCVLVLVTSGDERSHISRLPLWLIAGLGIVLFAWVGVRYADVLRGKERR
jgi:hypothetical protein